MSALTAGIENAIRLRSERALFEASGMPLATPDRDRDYLLAEIDALRARLAPAEPALTIGEMDGAINGFNSGSLSIEQMRAVLNRLIVAAPSQLADAIVAGRTS
jgi:hypothetical protein